MKLKKAISPVVATALLIVVSVVAVIGFQNWYSSYESTLLSNTEQRSSTSGGGIDIEYISSDGILYVNNRGNLNSTMTNIMVSEFDCSISQELKPGVTPIDISDCLINTGNNDIVIVTDLGIIEEKVFIKEFTFLDCSSLNGGEWIKVSGNVALGTNDFCVMKYEAKNVGGIATSQSALNPWGNLKWGEAKNNCTSLGTGYHLLNNAEWTTIARIIEQDSRNWNSSIIGTGGIYRGNVNLNDNLSCGSNSVLNGDTPGTNCVVGSRNKRTHYVGNNLIWDLSGNIKEFNDDQCTRNAPWFTLAWYQWTDANLAGASQEKELAGPAGPYTSTYGIGEYSGCSADNNVFARGGDSAIGAKSGIYHIDLSLVTWLSWANVGFRCAYSP